MEIRERRKKAKARADQLEEGKYKIKQANSGRRGGE